MTNSDTLLSRMAAIHRAKDADYGASYDLAPALLGIPAHVGLMASNGGGY